MAPAIPVEDIPIMSAALEGGADHTVTDDGGLLDVKTMVVSGYSPVHVIAQRSAAPRLTGAAALNRLPRMALCA